MTRKIELTRGFEAIIDDEDFDRVSKYKWRANVTESGTYAVTWMRRTGGKGRHVYLHRFLLGFPAGSLIGFANGNRLDCRRENLKFTTRSKSQINRSRSLSNQNGFKGVSLVKKTNKYKAYIRYRGVLIHLGMFDTANDAALAYNEKAVELYGKCDGLNKI